MQQVANDFVFPWNLSIAFLSYSRIILMDTKKLLRIKLFSLGTQKKKKYLQVLSNLIHSDEVAVDEVSWWAGV